ncbi:MAG TPA: hypothetical protein VFQ71_00650 [Gaiellales bacterium]|nr:hypothetical protein [Gaiellales bacterium]
MRTIADALRAADRVLCRLGGSCCVGRSQAAWSRSVERRSQRRA